MAALTYVTNGVLSFNPTLVDGYESERQTATVVHQILNRDSPDITIRPAALRDGTLRMLFADSYVVGGGLIVDGDGYVIEVDTDLLTGEAEAKGCEDAHAAGGVFQLLSGERTSIVMSYVASGGIRRLLEDATRGIWILEVDFHEVAT